MELKKKEFRQLTISKLEIISKIANILDTYDLSMLYELKPYNDKSEIVKELTKICMKEFQGKVNPNIVKEWVETLMWEWDNG